MTDLIRSAGERRLGPHAHISVHLTPRHGSLVRPRADLVWMKKVQSAHIERGVYSHAATAVRQALGELDAAVAVVEASIDVRGADLDELASAH